MEDEGTTTTKLGNAAPDFGRSLGIRELWSEIKPGLWVGGTHDIDTVGHKRRSRYSWTGGFNIEEDAEIGPDEFDAVVTLYAWARPVDWLVQEFRWGIYDSSSDILDPNEVLDVVKWAHKRWKDGKKTLIRCQAGISRSPLFTALVLIRDGMEIQEAIDLIRHNRSGHCLTMNGSSRDGQFTKMLMDTPVEFWRE